MTSCGFSIRRTATAICFAGCLFGLSLGSICGPADAPPGLEPPILSGDRPPSIIITRIITPPENDPDVAQEGDLVTIEFSVAEDSEAGAEVRVFSSMSEDPSAQGSIDIPIFGNDSVFGPGVSTGAAVWDTTGVAPGTYHIYASADDHNPDYDKVIVTSAHQVTVIPIPPEGIEALNSPPQLVFLDPLPNLGLASKDEVVVRYIYGDADNDVTLTLLLDTNLDPTDDDVNNPGDPQEPGTRIFILPSAARLPTDPTFDGDPPPPDDPNNMPNQADSLEIRTNPRSLGPTVTGLLPFPGAPLDGELKEYRFIIDFTQIPVRAEPYHVRATIDDGVAPPVHSYAVGSLSISSLASGIVDLDDIGFGLAGARFQGFSVGENLGTDFIALTDMDLDGPEDFMIASRFGSPRNRFQPGAAYLIYGRRKTPFPSDDNGNGLPDVQLPDGSIVDFPAPPDYLPNPYDARNVGRFGGVVSINSVSSFFRGTVYGMPEAHHDATTPLALSDGNHPGNHTAGLTSITRIDMTGDGVPDLVFGLPFVAGAWDHHDDDIGEGCGSPYTFAGDDDPNSLRCTRQPVNDDMWSPRGLSGPDPSDMGLVIMVDGTNDIRDTFNTFVDANLAGQHDPDGAIDDEGHIWGGGFVPRGMRFRGGWFDPTFTLDLNLEPPAPTLDDNGADDCANAPEIHEGLTVFDTTGAGTDPEALEHTACRKDGDDPDEGVHQDIWWRYTATCTGALRVETCIFGSADFDVRIAVYDAEARTCDCEEITESNLIGCSDDADECGTAADLTVFVLMGNCYLIRVGGYTTHEGTGELNITCTDFFDYTPSYYSDAEFGRTVATLPDFDHFPGDELIISSPGYDPLGGFDAFGDPVPRDFLDFDRGMIQIWLSHNYLGDNLYDDLVLSLPSYTACPEGTCTQSDPPICLRCYVTLPSYSMVIGKQRGDRFGFASAAGDFNQNGTEDVLAGAPGADRNGWEDCGVGYVLDMPSGGFGNHDLSRRTFPRLEIVGTHHGDRFGKVQTLVGDINGDSIEDVAFAAESFDDAGQGADAGYVGVIFGDRPITGEEGFFPEEVGSANLPGVRFLGAAAGALAGRDVASAGDFNGDGFGDLLISSPGEIRTVGGEDRLGVVYLVFGGLHLHNQSFELSQVGTRTLPGIVFISRFEQGSTDEAPLEYVGGLGDIDADGFDDIAIGAPTADFINLASPNQRRVDAGEFYIIYGSNFGTNNLGG